MTTVTAQTTVGELVAEHPALMRVFERLGIDYCCGGKRSLAEASADKGLDVNTIVQTLQAVVDLEQTDQPEEQNWAKADLAELCDHIEGTHHSYLRAELPRVSRLVDKVAQVHDENHPELHKVKEVFHDLVNELTSHLLKEERVLFPAIRQMVQNKDGAGVMSLAPPIRVMMMEHESAGQALAALRRLTNNYTVPADGCSSYAAMLKGLEEIEADLHRHIAKENNILFPRALALQEQ